jgi:(p)ppGpp synthase/HD superfamily hydrolase
MEIPQLTAIAIISAAAARAHAGMTRNDGITPYIVHPARVAALVEHFGGNYVAILSAWLHDVFEDCGPEACLQVRGTIDTLPLPGEDILNIYSITAALTKNEDLPKTARMGDSLARILQAPPEAALIKICDRIDNVIDARDRDDEFKITYCREAGIIVAQLGDAANASGYSEAVDTLNKVIRFIGEDLPG